MVNKHIFATISFFRLLISKGLLMLWGLFLYEADSLIFSNYLVMSNSYKETLLTVFDFCFVFWVILKHSLWLKISTL